MVTVNEWFLAVTLLAASKAYSIGDWCARCLSLSNFFKSLLFLQFLSASYKTWHTCSVCQCSCLSLFHRWHYVGTRCISVDLFSARCFAPVQRCLHYHCHFQALHRHSKKYNPFGNYSVRSLQFYLCIFYGGKLHCKKMSFSSCANAMRSGYLITACRHIAVVLPYLFRNNAVVNAGKFTLKLQWT